MSPIIYTPHDCDTPDGDLRDGTLWQCDVCETIWEADRRLIGEWKKIAQPRRGRIVADALKRPEHTSEPTTPTITPSMVQLVLDVYEDHMLVAPADGDGPDGPLGHCGECDAPIGPHTIMTHALEAAAAALQAEIDGGRDAQE